MNNYLNNKKLSHLILYVDKRHCNEAICAYCTNMSKNHPETNTILKSYDNQSLGHENFIYELMCIINEGTIKDNIFLITDSSLMSMVLAKEKYPFAVLRTAYNQNESLRHSLYCIENIEEIEYEVLYRMWQRFNKIPWKICETERTIIREQTLDDVDRLYEIYSDPSTTEYMESLYNDRDEEIEYMKDYISNQYRFCEYGLWAIEDKANGKLIGRAGVSQRVGYDELELGYVIATEYRRKGYCTEVIRDIIKYMQENFVVESLIAFTQEENIASRALLEKLSFSVCGIENIDGKQHLMYRRILT